MNTKISFFLILQLLFFHLSHAQINFNKNQTIELPRQNGIVCVDDINNDGRADIITSEGTELCVFIQDSIGNINNKIVSEEIFYSISAIDICDIDNNNFNDIIIACSDSIAIIYMNDSCTLNNIEYIYSGGERPDALKTGYINNDSLFDIVVSHIQDTFLSVLYQTENGFTPDFIFAPYSFMNQIEIVDLNNDGLTDLVYHSDIHYSAGIYIYLQKSTEEFVHDTTLLVGNTWIGGFDVGDVNSDGLNDIVGTISRNLPTGKLFVFLQDPINKKFKSETNLVSYEIPQPIKISDLDCDGLNEIITVHGGWESISIYEENKSHEFKDFNRISIDPSSSHYQHHGLSIGDVNSDNKDDIVIALSLEGLLILYNSSVPNLFDSITLTKTNIDTLYSSTYLDTSYFMNNDYSYYSEIMDSSIIINEYYTDSIQFDSTYIRYGEDCSGRYTDTITLTNILSKNEVTIDTLHTSKKELNNIIIYPNPTEKHVFIDFSNYLIKESAIINLYSLKRELLQTKTIKNNSEKTFINLEKYSQSIFLLEIKIDNKISYRKIVKIS